MARLARVCRGKRLREISVVDVPLVTARMAKGFERAADLEMFRIDLSLTGADLLEVLQVPRLTELGAQHAQVTPAVAEAFAAAPALWHLDLECAELDDAAVEILSRSETIEMLEIGHTAVTAASLRDVARMQQLRGLDIWMTDIAPADLAMLEAVPEFEYLSVGGGQGQTRLLAADVIPQLEAMPALKRVWLDRIALTEAETARLRARLELVNA